MFFGFHLLHFRLIIFDLYKCVTVKLGYYWSLFFCCCSCFFFFSLKHFQLAYRFFLPCFICLMEDVEPCYLIDFFCCFVYNDFWQLSSQNRPCLMVIFCCSLFALLHDTTRRILVFVCLCRECRKFDIITFNKINVDMCVSVFLFVVSNIVFSIVVHLHVLFFIWFCS